MDKKKVREAIGRLQVGINAKRENIKLNKKFYPKQDNIQLEEDITVYETAIEALKKQLPKKVENWNGQASCPGCKKLFGNMADIKMLRYWDFDCCNRCSQRLDWSEEES